MRRDPRASRSLLLLPASFALTLTLTLAPRAAAAEAWPEDLFATTLYGAIRWDGSSAAASLGLRASWTNLRTELPWGADLELAWLPARAAIRVSPALHVYPGVGPAGAGCTPAERRHARGKRLGVGLSAALALGGVVELGRPEPDLGGWLGGAASLTLVGAHARATYLARQGPELEAGAGLRVPSIQGELDAPSTCE